MKRQWGSRRDTKMLTRGKMQKVRNIARWASVLVNKFTRTQRRAYFKNIFMKLKLNFKLIEKVKLKTLFKQYKFETA